MNATSLSLGLISLKLLVRYIMCNLNSFPCPFYANPFLQPLLASLKRDATATRYTARAD